MFQPPWADLGEYEDTDINQIWEDEDDRDYAKAIWERYMVQRGGFVREHASAAKPVWGESADPSRARKDDRAAG